MICLQYAGCRWIQLCFVLMAGLSACSDQVAYPDESGTFLVFRRQSLIGEENYTVRSSASGTEVYSLQGENERGRISGVEAKLVLDAAGNPVFYENRRLTSNDTTNVLRVEVTGDNVQVHEKFLEPVSLTRPDMFFPLHSNIPAAMEGILYRFYQQHQVKDSLPLLPRGALHMVFRQSDQVLVEGQEVTLNRYVVEGINWGGRTVWLDTSGNLVALVQANTQIREMIKKGYESALPFFVAGNVEEQMMALAQYPQGSASGKNAILALVGADLVDGLSPKTQKGMTLIVENGKIAAIGPQDTQPIPEGATILDLSGKTLIPGLWDMHAHANQVQWGPAYLAGGVTTVRDNGNELEFVTAFRDAVRKGATGPDIVMAGMTDGEGITGNGIVRARNLEEAAQVVALYEANGYQQIKIYNAIQPDVLAELTKLAHEKGLSVTGHVPVAVGNAADAILLGMDQLSHTDRILSVLFPDKKLSDLKGNYLLNQGVTPDQIERATRFLLEHKTVLDPTIALDRVRDIPAGTPIETVEPDAYRIAYELFEGKRFQSGTAADKVANASNNTRLAMDILGQFFRAGVPIVAGTDNAVPVFSLYLEVETYHALGGLSPLEALQTATIIPARAMGMGQTTGTLEVGKEADIAVLAQNPLIDIRNLRTVTGVLTNGVYFESNALWPAVDFLPGNEQQ